MYSNYQKNNNEKGFTIFICLFIVIIAFMFICIGATLREWIGYETIYAKAGIVTEIDYHKDFMIITDWVGNEWEIIGCDDWHLNDLCAMSMSNNGTPDNNDDIILNIRYNGQLEWLAERSNTYEPGTENRSYFVMH